jgi:hypothetical protein
MDTLVDQLTTPENKQRLSTFFSVVNDILKKPQQVVITDSDESKLVVSQSNGHLVFNVTKGFINALGNHTLTVCGAIDDNTVYQPPEPEKPFVPGEQDYTRLLANGYLLFLKSDDKYVVKYTNHVLENMPDISIINYIKRNNLDENIFQMVKTSLNNNGVKYYIVGDPWPEKERVEPDGVKIVYVERPVITERIVEVQKVVLKEVPVYVDKVIIKEVEKNQPVAPPTEQSTTTESEESDDEGEESGEEEESDESTESEESDEPPPATSSLKIKGTFLNAQKTIVKSGEYVYRIVKKASGQSKLEAIGRWNPKQKAVIGATWLKLLPSDTEKIVKLGHTVAKNPE